MFSIDGTDFEIDGSRSWCSVKVDADGRVTIDAEVVGDLARHAAVSRGAGSPWGWALYPPRFYVRGLPARPGAAQGCADAVLVRDDLDDVEGAIYLMAHHDLDETSVAVTPAALRVRGVVWISGRRLGFVIELPRS